MITNASFFRKRDVFLDNRLQNHYTKDTMHTILRDLEELVELPAISKIGILALLILLFTLGILIGKKVNY